MKASGMWGEEVFQDGLFNSSELKDSHLRPPLNGGLQNPLKSL